MAQSTKEIGSAVLICCESLYVQYWHTFDTLMHLMAFDEALVQCQCALSTLIQYGLDKMLLLHQFLTVVTKDDTIWLTASSGLAH